MVNTENLLQSALMELAAGRNESARRILSRYIIANPRHEKAWLYIAATLPKEHAIESLQRVLMLNPGNRQASRGLQILRTGKQARLDLADVLACAEEDYAIFGHEAATIPAPAIFGDEQETIPFAFFNLAKNGPQSKSAAQEAEEPGIVAALLAEDWTVRPVAAPQSIRQVNLAPEPEPVVEPSPSPELAQTGNLPPETEASRAATLIEPEPPHWEDNEPDVAVAENFAPEPLLEEVGPEFAAPENHEPKLPKRDYSLIYPVLKGCRYWRVTEQDYTQEEATEEPGRTEPVPAAGRAGQEFSGAKTFREVESGWNDPFFEEKSEGSLPPVRGGLQPVERLEQVRLPVGVTYVNPISIEGRTAALSDNPSTPTLPQPARRVDRPPLFNLDMPLPAPRPSSNRRSHRVQGTPGGLTAFGYFVVIVLVAIIVIYLYMTLRQGIAATP